MFSDVSRRYARALFDVAAEAGDDLRELEGGLVAFVEAVETSQPLLRALGSPATPRESRAALAESVARRIAPGTRLSRFAALMVSKDRVGSLAEAAGAFSALVDEREGVVVGEVTSAQRLDPATRSRLEGALGKAFGGRARLAFREDPNLLGGLVLRTGNRIYDASLKRELARFTERALALR